MRVSHWWSVSLLALMLLLAACGPSPDEANGEDAGLVTRDIAQTYAASRDLTVARSSLDLLGVANTNQWLILVAEEAIGEGPNGDADALTLLALDMGLRSAIVDRYASQRGFTTTAAAPTATSAPVSAAVAAPTQSVAQIEPTATSTAALAEVAPTQTPAAEEAAPTTAATDTPAAQAAQVQASSPMNVRAGPSTEHPIIAAMQTGTNATILAKNAAGDWWQVTLGDGSVGWIYAPLVSTVGNVGSVEIAAAIPTSPPALPTATPAPTSAPAPAAEPTAAAEQPTATPAPATGGPDFRLVEQRLWGVEENGGHLAGTSVNCGEKQVLEIVVEDASGARLNGVTVQGVYRNELHVTGEKGDGVAQMDINKDGDDVMVLRDVDGREVSSDRAVGNTARTYNIPHEQLIQGRYCSDTASCQSFVNTNGCFGHFSWTVRFRRSY